MFATLNFPQQQQNSVLKGPVNWCELYHKQGNKSRKAQALILVPGESSQAVSAVITPVLTCNSKTNSQNTEKQYLTSFYDNSWRCATTQYQCCLKIVVNADRQVSSRNRQITRFSQVSSLPRKSLQCFSLHLPFQILYLSPAERAPLPPTDIRPHLCELLTHTRFAESSRLAFYPFLYLTT